MKTKQFLFLLFLCLPAVVFTQVDKAWETKNANPNLELPQSVVDKNADFEQDASEPWLKKPYLNVTFDKATVGELTIAFYKWRKDNPDGIRAGTRKKDDGTAKFARKLHLWQMENDWNQVPIHSDERLEAFRTYETKNALLPQMESINPDANWQLLGPVNNPEEVAFTEPAVSANKSVDNAGLGRINCLEFSIWDTLNIWAGTSTGGVWKTWNGGKNWINISMTLPIMEISDIAIDQSNSNIIYVAVGDRDGRGGWYGNGVGSRLYKTTDGGSTWFPINANFGTGTFIMNLWVHPKRTSEVVVVKTNGIYKSVDGGANWTQTLTTNYVSPFNAPNNNLFKSAAYGELSSPERMYALYRKRYSATAFSYQIQRSDDFGTNWRVMDSITTPINDRRFQSNIQKLAIAPSDPNCVYLYSSEVDTVFRQDRFGLISRTLDGGRTWENRSRYPSVPNTQGWMLGDSSDIGSQGSYDLILTVDPKNRDRVFIGGVDMWGSTNGGTTFNKTTFWVNSLGISAHADHHWGEYQPISGSYFLATDGGLYKTRNLAPGNNDEIAACANGRNDLYELITQAYTPGCYTFPTRWDFVGNGISNLDLYAISVSKSDPTRVLAGAQDNGTLKRKNGNWYAVLGGDGFIPMFHPTNPNTYYGSLYYGWTFRTDDDGLTYRSVSTAMDTIDQGDWLTAMDMSEANPNIIVQARQQHVWRTLDGGNTWKIISNFPQGTVASFTDDIAMAQSDPNIMIAARFTASPVVMSLYKTTNGGATWANIWNPAFPTSGSVADIKIHPTQPNKVWIAFRVGFSSANPDQSKKLFYSEDGGTTWTNITVGLPPVPVWSIAIQGNSTVGAVYVGTAVGVFYKDATKTRFQEFQVGMPRGVMVTDLKIHEGVGKIYAGTYGRGVWAANLYDRPYDGGTVASAKPNRNLLLNVYPNPANDYIRIVWDDNNKEDQTLNVMDINGRVLFNKRDFSGRTTVDISQYAAGVYTVQLVSGKEVLVKKFTVSK